jgi:hypothetical protein
MGEHLPMPDDRPEPPDRHRETAADREAAWLERELYEQDSARWEREDERDG